MAITQVGGTTGNAINAGSITLTLPGGMSVNDLILIAYGVGDDDFTQPTLAMTTAGYTEVTSSTLSADGGAGGDGNLAVFYKYHNGTDTNAVTTAAGTGSDSSCGACLTVFRGVRLAADGGPFEVTSTTATGTSGGDPNPPSISGFTEASSAVVIACSVGNAAAITLTAPTNYTTNARNAVGNDTFDCSVGLAYRLSGAGDPENPGVFTDSGTGVAWCAVTMVLKAATIDSTNGDITAQAADITASGLSASLSTDGAIAAQAADITSEGISESLSTDGAISAGSASMTGTGTVEDAGAITGTGALDADAADITATGISESLSTDGAIAAQASDITSTGASSSNSVDGAIFADGADITSVGLSASLSTDGDIFSGAAQIDGTGIVGDEPPADSNGVFRPTYRSRRR